MLRKGIFVYVCCKKCSLYSSVPVEESDRMTEDRDKWRKYVRGVASGHPSDRGRLKNRTEQDCDKMDDFCTKPVHAANETACGGLRRRLGGLLASQPQQHVDTLPITTSMS